MRNTNYCWHFLFCKCNLIHSLLDVGVIQLAMNKDHCQQQEALLFPTKIINVKLVRVMRLPADIYCWLWQMNDEFKQKVWKPEQSWAAKQPITAWLAQNLEKVTETPLNQTLLVVSVKRSYTRIPFLPDVIEYYLHLGINKKGNEHQSNLWRNLSNGTKLHQCI